MISPTIHINTDSSYLWSYRIPGTKYYYELGVPVLHINDSPFELSLKEVTLKESLQLPHGVLEQRWLGGINGKPGMYLEIRLRLAPKNPVVRFQYLVSSLQEVLLTNVAPGANSLLYTGITLGGMKTVKEVRLSCFNEMIHSFNLEEHCVHDSQFSNSGSLMGPIVTASDGNNSILLAYEHGSQFPNRFLSFELTPERYVKLAAVKGNYFHGQSITLDKPFETVWFQFAAIQGSEANLASEYRDFVRRWQSPNMESRKPYIFYNTWNYQERLKNWKQESYLAEMNERRILAEIEVAHAMGIEVFVIDTGWYQKTGDWQVNRSRFPDGLKAIKTLLASYNMKLGLWFNPTVAALTSRMWRDHQDCIQEWQGVRHKPSVIWETEESQGLCLVSRYADAYADEMIRLVKEIGVTYFKWDAIGQEGMYSCDSPQHHHGTPENTASECNNCYAFEQVRSMNRIIDKVCAECPDAIFDFDVTEGGRCMGLAFLASGKYFLINNGPYHWNYDLPAPKDGNANLFFFPGAARSWICRSPLTYDKWIPSVLFLTHYLPDLPKDSQLINAISLMLGQNGIWGDLLSLDVNSIELWKRLLSLYKQIRHDLQSARLILTGMVGGSPEIYEKIAANGRGLVAVFANAAGTYDYVTNAERVAEPHFATEGIEMVKQDGNGRAVIRFSFSGPSGRLILFGADNTRGSEVW
jgi:alpha-galactosidase